MDLTPKPAPEHSWLSRHTGTWNARITTTVFPGAPPMEWSGTIHISMTGGGLWQVLDFKGEMMGRPFAGHGMTGFDPFQKKFVQCWGDSMSPNMLQLKGDLDEVNKTLVMAGEMQTPMGCARMKQITREVSVDELLFLVEVPAENGKDFTVMRAVYTRAR